MPLYQYECDACGKRFEVIQKFSDALADVCRHCGKGPVHKLMSSPAIQFKGSGWYITDYAQKGKNEGKNEGKNDSSSTTPTTKDAPAGESSAGTSSSSDSTKTDSSSAAKPAAESTAKTTTAKD